MLREFSLKFLFLVLIAGLMAACEMGGDSDGYYFEDDYEEADEVAEQQTLPTPEQMQSPLSGEADNITMEDMPVVNHDSIPDQQDKEPAAATVKDLIKLNMTNGVLDTNKITAAIVNTLDYVSKQNLNAGFACENIAYFGTNIMLPIEKNESSASIYVPADFGGKRYHFILLNVRGYVSGKNYVVDCSRNDFSYKELFVFYPSSKTRTQSSLLLGVSDEYLQDVQTMININWRMGEEDADNKDYGVYQFNLKKLIPS